MLEICKMGLDTDYLTVTKHGLVLISGHLLELDSYVADTHHTHKTTFTYTT